MITTDMDSCTYALSALPTELLKSLRDFLTSDDCSLWDPLTPHELLRWKVVLPTALINSYPPRMMSWLAANSDSMPENICLTCFSAAQRLTHRPHFRKLLDSVRIRQSTVHLRQCDFCTSSPLRNSILLHQCASRADKVINAILLNRQNFICAVEKEWSARNTSSAPSDPLSESHITSTHFQSGRDPIMRAGPSGPDVHYVDAEQLTAIHTQRAASNFANPASQYRDTSFMQDVIDSTTGKTDRHIQLPPFTIDSSTSYGHEIWSFNCISDLLQQPGTAVKGTAHNPAVTRFFAEDYWTADAITLTLVASGSPYISGCARLRAIPFPYNKTIDAYRRDEMTNLAAMFATNSPLLNYSEQNPVSLTWNWEGPYHFASTSDNLFIPQDPVTFVVVVQDPAGAGSGVTSTLEVRPTLTFTNLRGAGDRITTQPVSLQAPWVTPSATRFQSGDDESPVDNAPTSMSNGESPIDTEAPAVDVSVPVVSDHGIPSQVLIQDLMKRGNTAFEYVGGFCSESDGQLRQFTFPLNYYPQTLADTTTERRLNAFETLSRVSFYCSGGVRYLIYYTSGDGTTRTVSIYSQPHTQEFIPTDNEQTFEPAVVRTNPRMNIVSAGTLDIDADRTFNETVWNLALEKRETGVNPVLDLLTPNHFRLACTCSHPPSNYNFASPYSPWLMIKYFCPSWFRLRSKKPTKDVVLDSVEVVRAATDYTAFGALGVLPPIYSVPNSEGDWYTYVPSEVPSRVFRGDGTVNSVLPVAAFQYADGPIGGALGRGIFPLEPTSLLGITAFQSGKDDSFVSKVSSTAKTVGDVATGVQNAAKAVEPAVSAVTSIWDTVAPFLGMLFDRPNAADMSESRWLRTNDNISNVHGKIQAVSLDVDPQAKESPSSGFAYVDNHHSLVSTPGLLFNRVIPSDTGSNTFLCAVPVTPMAIGRGDYVHGSTATYNYPTPLSLVASQFQTYTGNLIYDFFFSKAPSESLIVSTFFHPGGFLEDVNQILQLRGETHQIKEKVQFSHIVNFQHPVMHFMHNPPPRFDDTNGNGIIPSRSIGYLYIVLTQKIVSSPLTKGSVNMFVSVRGEANPSDPGYTRFFHPTPSPFIFTTCGHPYESEARADPVRDLTQDGDVESNPGPASAGPSGLSRAASAVKETVAAALATPKNLNETLSATTKAAESVSQTSDHFSSIALKVDNVIKMIMDFFAKPMAWLGDGFSFKDMFNVAKDLYCAYRSDQYDVKVFSAVGLLVNLGFITADSAVSLVFKLKEVVADSMSSMFQASDDDADLMPAKWFMMLISAIAGTFSLTCVPKNVSFPKHLLTTFSDVFRSFNAFDVFIVKNLKALKAGWRWIVDKFYGAALADDMIADNLPDIRQWLGRVDVLARSDVESKKKDVEFHHELMNVLDDGSVLLQAIATTDLSPRARGLNTVLMARYKLVYDIFVQLRPWIKLKNTAFVPYCIWITGVPGIGKSDIVSELAVALCKSMMIEYGADPSYVVTPGSKHWDAFAQEPIGVYDDPEQVKSEEALSEFLSTFFKVLSPVPFVVPQAHVDSKNTLHKFMSCIVTSNVDYPDTKGLLASVDAFYERRDVLLRFELTSSFKAFLAQHRVEWAGRQTFDILNARDLKFEGDVIDVYELPNKRGAGEERYMGPWTKYYPGLVRQATRAMAKRCERAKKKQELFKTIAPGWVEKYLDGLEKADAEEATSLFKSLHGMMPGTRQQSGRDRNPRAKRSARVPKGREQATPAQGNIVSAGPSDASSLASEERASSVALPSESESEAEESLYSCTDTDVESIPRSTSSESVMSLERGPINPVNPCSHHMTLKLLEAGKATACFLSSYDTGPNGLAQENIFFVQEVSMNGRAYSFPGAEYCAARSVRGGYCCLSLTWARKMRAAGCDISPADWEWLACNLPRSVDDVEVVFMKDWKRSSVLPVMAKILTGIAVMVGVVAALNWVVAPVQQSKTYDYAHTSKRVAIHRSKGSAVKYTRQQAVQYPNLTVAVLDACDESGQRVTTTRALALGGFDYLVSRHFIEHCENSVHSIRFSYRNKSGSMSEGECLWSKCDVVIKTNDGSTDPDLATIRIPSSQAHKNIIKAFANNNDHAGFSGEGVLIIENRSCLTLKSVRCARTQHTVTQSNQVTLDCYVYRYSGDGYCGTPLLDERSGRILGIHAFGNCTGSGGAVVVTREAIEAMRQAFETDDVVDIEDQGGEPAELDGILRSDFVDVTRVQSGFEGCIPLGRTDLKKSPVYAALGEPTKHPRRAPATDIAKAVSQYAGVSEAPDVDDLDQCVEHFTRVFVARAPPARALGPGVLSPQQVWCGIAGNPYYSAIQKSTSVGIPTRNVKGLRNKGSCVQIETKEGTDRLVGYHPWYAERLQSRLDLLRAGVVPTSFYHFFLKDECTKKDQSRGINGADAVDQQLFLQYFGDFFSAMDAANLKVCSAVTLDIEKRGMDLLMHLTELSKEDPEHQRYITGDYKGFGPTILKDVLRAFGEVIQNWYQHYEPDTPKKEENQKFRSLLWLSLCQSKHVVNNVVVTTDKGCPSGNPRTDKINTGCNLFYFGLGWLSIARYFDPSMATLHHFDINVRAAMYGDDVVATSLVPWFNSCTLQVFFEHLGIVYTDAHKRADTAPTDSLEKMSFLKRTFAKHPTRTGVYLARIDKEVLAIMTSYTRGKTRQEQVENSLQTSHDACRFAYAWGPSFYKEVCERLSDAWARAGQVFTTRSWSSMDSVIWDSQPIGSELPKDPLVFY